MVSLVAGGCWLERLLSTKAQSTSTCIGLASCNLHVVALSLHQFPMSKLTSYEGVWTTVARELAYVIRDDPLAAKTDIGNE